MNNSFDNNPPLRELPIALGQVLATTKLGNEARQVTLHRLFKALKPADQLRCQIELMNCKRAMRGETLAFPSFASG